MKRNPRKATNMPSEQVFNNEEVERDKSKKRRQVDEAKINKVVEANHSSSSESERMSISGIGASSSSDSSSSDPTPRGTNS